MSEAYLSSLGGHSLPGLDIGQVERERKEMWRLMFQKYQDMEENDELAEEVALEDIDKPETVNSIFKGQMQSCLMQPSSTLKQYFMEHAEEMDEIATIAGETVSDEEVLSDDSDEELLFSESDASNNVVDGEAGGDNIGNNQLPLTPATSEDDENASDVGQIENNEQDDGDIDVTLSERNEDDNETLAESDEDDDMLYSAGPLPESKNIFDQTQPESLSKNPISKRPRLTPPSEPHVIANPPCGEDIHASDQNVTTRPPVDEVPSNDNNIQVSAEEVSTKVAGEDEKIVNDENTEQNNLNCSHCLTSTFYQALPSSAGFLCDECMAGDHLHCEVEECRVCREVGEIISLRRQAEVFGRIQKTKKL